MNARLYCNAAILSRMSVYRSENLLLNTNLNYPINSKHLSNIHLNTYSLLRSWAIRRLVITAQVLCKKLLYKYKNLGFGYIIQTILLVLNLILTTFRI